MHSTVENVIRKWRQLKPKQKIFYQISGLYLRSIDPGLDSAGRHWRQRQQDWAVNMIQLSGDY